MKRILCVLIILMLLMGCSRTAEKSETSVESSESREETSVPESSEESAPVEESSQEEEPEPAPMQPLRRLESIGDDIFVRGLQDAGDGQIVLETSIITYGSYDAAMIGTKFQRLDVATGKVIFEGAPRSEDEFMIGLRPNGEVVTFSYYTEEVSFYDAKFQFIRAEKLDSGGFTPNFDRAGDCFYMLEGETLYKLPASASPMADHKEALLSGLRSSFLTPLDAKSGLMILQEPGFTLEKNLFTVYDGVKNKEWMTIENNMPTFMQCGDYLLVRDFEWVDSEHTKDFLIVYQISSGEEVACYEISDISMTYTSSTSPYMFIQNSEMDFSENLLFGPLMLSSPAEGRFTELDLGEATYQLMDAVCDESTGHWILVLENQDNKDTRTTLWELAPELIELDQEFTPYQPVEAPKEYHEVGEVLSSCRAEADRIEEAYGVEILLGDEVLDYPEASAYRLISIEDPDVGIAETDLNFVEVQLKLLDDTLALYPEGFFDMFKDRHGNGGIRFLLVQELVNDYGEFVAAGEQSMSGLWYNISLDVDTFIEYSIHHELWHATDNLLYAAGNGVDYEEWMNLNPPDFEYISDYDTYVDDSEKYIDYVLYGYDPWFATTYSLVNGNEDRATLIETVFVPYEYTSSIGDCTGYEAIKASPHLVDKLNYLAEKVNATFGYVYWEIMMGE